MQHSRRQSNMFDSFYYRSYNADGTLDLEVDFGDEHWLPLPAATALGDVADDLCRTRRLKLSLGPFGPGPHLTDAFWRAGLSNLTELRLQSNEHIQLDLGPAPRLMRLCLDGVQPRDWPALFAESNLTHLELANLTLPMSVLHECLSSCPDLVYLSLSSVLLVIDRLRFKRVAARRLEFLKLRLSDARGTLMLLDMLPLKHIREISASLQLATCYNERIVEMLSDTPGLVEHLRIEGTTLDLADGKGTYLRRFQNVSPQAIQHALHHLEMQHSLCDKVQEVTLGAEHLQTVATVVDSFWNARYLRIALDNGDTLREYLAACRLPVRFPALVALDIDAFFVSRTVLCAFLASTCARRLRVVDGFAVDSN